MNEAKCAYCFSTSVTIISSDQTREAALIQCLDCGKTSEIDTENFNVETGDLPPE
jgi:transcription elongation factor Elf1